MRSRDGLRAPDRRGAARDVLVLRGLLHHRPGYSSSVRGPRRRGHADPRSVGDRGRRGPGRRSRADPPGGTALPDVRRFPDAELVDGDRGRGHLPVVRRLGELRGPFGAVPARAADAGRRPGQGPGRAGRIWATAKPTVSGVRRYLAVLDRAGRSRHGGVHLLRQPLHAPRASRVRARRRTGGWPPPRGRLPTPVPPARTVGKEFRTPGPGPLRPPASPVLPGRGRAKRGRRGGWPSPATPSARLIARGRTAEERRARSPCARALQRPRGRYRVSGRARSGPSERERPVTERTARSATPRPTTSWNLSGPSRDPGPSDRTAPGRSRPSRTAL